MDDAAFALRRFLPAPARRAFKKARSLTRALHRTSARSVDADRLVSDLRGAGVRTGDTLCVHSSLASVGKVDGGAETVIRALMTAVGDRGTILMPAYGTAEAAIRASLEDRPIDLRTESSQTGKITETFRRTPGVLRSSHPFSSICAWGAKAEFVTAAHDANERICHPDSPLARLLLLGGKVVGLGVSLGPVSFYHVVEDTWEAFPFNTYSEAVEITYVDARGNRVRRRVAYYDRALTRRRIDADGGISIRRFLTEHLRKRELLVPFTFGQGESWLFSCNDVYEELKSLAGQGVTIYAENSALTLV